MNDGCKSRVSVNRPIREDVGHARGSRVASITRVTIEISAYIVCAIKHGDLIGQSHDMFQGGYSDAVYGQSWMVCVSLIFVACGSDNSANTGESNQSESMANAGGQTGDDTGADKNVIAQVIGNATEEQCENGGVVLKLGVDLNGDNVLDDDEVTGTEPVCNGLDGNDGADVRNGADGLDGVDGMNGADGMDGIDGMNGADGMNGPDGMDAFAPNGVIYGTVTIDPLNAHLMQAVTEVQGDLTITAGGSLEFPVLETVSGSLTVNENAHLTELSLPALTTVGGTLDLTNNAALTDFGVPALITVSGALHLEGCDALAALNLPTLTSVDGSLRIEQNEALSRFGAPVLATAGDVLIVDENEALAELTLSTLVTVGGSLQIEYNNALTIVNLPALTTVVNEFSLQGNPSHRIQRPGAHHGHVCDCRGK